MTTSIRFSFRDDEKINYLVLEWAPNDPSRPTPQGMSKIVTEIIDALGMDMPVVESIEVKKAPIVPILNTNHEDPTVTPFDDNTKTDVIVLPSFRSS